MSGLVRWMEESKSVTPSRLNRVEAKAYGRALTRMEHQAELVQRSVDLEADIGRTKVCTVAHVGNEAMTAQALIAGRQRLLVEAEPSAVHGVSYIGQKLTMALGAVVDDVVREVTK